MATNTEKTNNKIVQKVLDKFANKTSHYKNWDKLKERLTYVTPEELEKACEFAVAETRKETVERIFAELNCELKKKPFFGLCRKDIVNLNKRWLSKKGEVD